MAFWPVELPQSLDLQGYQEAVPSTTVRTEMDQGPAKVRRRFTAAARPISGSITITAAQVATLRTFYETTTFGGAEAFDWISPIDGVVVSMRFVDLLDIRFGWRQL